MDTDKIILCAATEVQDCLATQGCEQVQPEDVDVPTFMRLNLRKDRIEVGDQSVAIERKRRSGESADHAGRRGRLRGPAGRRGLDDIGQQRYWSIRCDPRNGTSRHHTVRGLHGNLSANSETKKGGQWPPFFVLHRD